MQINFGISYNTKLSDVKNLSSPVSKQTQRSFEFIQGHGRPFITGVILTCKWKLNGV